MKILGVIPARYQSTRFPGKPLAMIGQKTMIQCVYEQVKKSSSITELVVATDDERICQIVQVFGGLSLMTSKKHNNGTERCNEVLNILSKENKKFDIVINIQGDEPFIQQEQIDQLATCFTNKDIQIATLAKKISSTNELFNPNVVKVVVTMNKQAIYFSRSAIPCIRGIEQQDWIKHYDFYKHLGIYAYRSDVLKKIISLRPCLLEQVESLEQLRWIENGFAIFVEQTDIDSMSVDTPEDLKNK